MILVQVWKGGASVCSPHKAPVVAAVMYEIILARFLHVFLYELIALLTWSVASSSAAGKDVVVV